METPSKDTEAIVADAVEIDFPGGYSLEQCIKRAIERAGLMDKVVKFNFNNIIVIASSESTAKELLEKVRAERTAATGKPVGPF